MDTAPLEAIEDLCAAVSEEMPFVLLLDDAQRSDGESLRALDSIHRTGQARLHSIVLAASHHAPPEAAPAALRWIRRLQLPPLATTDTEALVAEYARSAYPRATGAQITCAALFAEGIPMYGIEMLGLVLDEGSPDVIPWKVQASVDAALRTLSDVQRRILALCALVPSSATRELLAAVFGQGIPDIVMDVESLGAAGLLRFEQGVFVPMRLMADAAGGLIAPSDFRGDAFCAGRFLAAFWPDSAAVVSSFYDAIRTFIVASDESYAEAFLERHTTALVRRHTAHGIVHELSRLKQEARTTPLRSMLEQICEQLLMGSDGKRRTEPRSSATGAPVALPAVSDAFLEIAHTVGAQRLLDGALESARRPNSSPAQRLAEAGVAVSIASNIGDLAALASARHAANAVRDSFHVTAFDVCRADLIYHTSIGDRVRALECAEQLTYQCQAVPELHLACVGLRNASEAFAYFGAEDRAMQSLHECRDLAVRFGYTRQLIVTDLRFADLAIEAMDVATARAYIAQVRGLLESRDLHAPLDFIELSLMSCWEALISGDPIRAAKEENEYGRLVDRGAELRGIELHVRLALKVATHTEPDSNDFRSAFAALSDSLGSSRFYPTETWSLAALLLASRKAGTSDQTIELVKQHTPRIEAIGRPMWPFVTQLINGL